MGCASTRYTDLSMAQGTVLKMVGEGWEMARLPLVVR